MENKLFIKRFFCKKLIPVYFVLLYIGLFFLMGYPKVSSLGPSSRHSWRQSDSYAFALTYFYDNNKFFEPAILFQGEQSHGKVVSEFPILYYLTAKIWKFTGVTPFVLRLINLVILFIGLFFLYKLAFLILKDHFWAVFVSLFLFSSPLLGYYGFNMIPNIPALACALIACYFSYCYYETSRIHYLILSTLLFSFGALFKITCLFSFLAINAVLLIKNVISIKKDKKPLLLQVGSVAFVILIVLTWYMFVKEYNTHNLNGFFNQSILPIWGLSQNRIHEIQSLIYTNNLIYFFNPIAFLTIITLFLFTFFLLKRLYKPAFFITVVLLVGVVLFVLLFFDGMDAHEYFLIDATIIIPAITITLLTTFKNLSSSLFHSKYVKGIAFTLLLLSINYSIVLTRSHYNPHDKFVTGNIPLASWVRNYWVYCYNDWESSKKKYEGIIPYLRSLGITFDDKVITIPDETPNLTLTLMHQKGFTDCHYWNNYSGKRRTERKMELGAKYMIIRGDENLLREDVAPFTQNQIGEYNGIRIFKLVN
ncbi:MAG: glycosyltransferase family 39 protein [Bacteroidales bacterium]|nr:glycosyltransferase family 39 protein [Bacteroidales bacterium]